MVKKKPKLKVYEDDTGAVWVRSPELQKRFSLCRTTIYTLLSEMRKMPKYCQSFLDLSHTLRLVKLADFESFLRERSDKKHGCVKWLPGIPGRKGKGYE